MRGSRILMVFLVLLMATVLSISSPVSAEYSPVDLDVAIELVQSLEIMSGWGGDFHEHELFTREQLATVAVRMSNLEGAAIAVLGSSATMYADAPSADSWSTKYIITAYSHDLMTGDVPVSGVRSFRPRDRASLDEAVTIVIRVILGRKLDGPWPGVYRATAVQMGLLTETESDRGSAAATRGEIARLVHSGLKTTTRGRALLQAIVDCRSLRTAQLNDRYSRNTHYNGEYMQYRIVGGYDVEISGTAPPGCQLMQLAIRPAGSVLTAISKRVGIREDRSYGVRVSFQALTPGAYDIHLFGDHEYRGTLQIAMTINGPVTPASPVLAYNVLKMRESSEVIPDHLSLAHLGSSDRETIRALSTDITGDLVCKYVKMVAIADWVSDNIYYDYELAASGMGNPGVSAATFWSMETLRLRRSVCQGYAELTIGLLRAAGIPCRLVSGLAVSSRGDWDDADDGSTNHAWVEAYVQGTWIILDTTWNSRNAYEHGEYVYGGTRGSYFTDANLASFSHTHRIERYRSCLKR